ncbi:MAG TPA: hypothetical protein P5205_15555 [Candidatus Paceibacterota bacterium]|nr:hypothetical protein [Candidatus Paceibacterota bacterium]
MLPLEMQQDFVVVQFLTQPGFDYWILGTHDPDNPDSLWFYLGQMSASGTTTSFVDGTSGNEPVRYYQVYEGPTGLYSRNAVGYVRRALPTGFTHVVTPRHFPNTVGAMFPSAPDGAAIIDALGNTNYCSNYGYGDAEWDDPDMMIAPAQSYTFYNPNPSDWHAVFAGVFIPEFSVPFDCVYATPFTFTTLAGRAAQGSADGSGTAAQFNNPQAIAARHVGTGYELYVADRDNHTLRKVVNGVVTTLAGLPGSPGSQDGTTNTARFSAPSGVAVSASGTVYVADGNNHTIRKVTPQGVVTTLAGLPGLTGGQDGQSGEARFNSPCGLALDNAGTLYVADKMNHTIRAITPAGLVTTLAGGLGLCGSNDGTGSAARFSHPTGVAVDGAGNVYVADADNSTIRKVTPSGVVTTLAGMAGSYGSGDGPSLSARFTLPQSITVDNATNLYVADSMNHTVRKLTPQGTGWVVSTLAGLAGVSGSEDDAGSAARFKSPAGVAVDSQGRIYVADTRNNLIRRITSAGSVSTIAGDVWAGTPGSTDGKGNAATFSTPSGAAVDSSRNIYVADAASSIIRVVNSQGYVSTLAGNPGINGSVDGIGSEALFYGPSGVAVDSVGNVYVADTTNHTIRYINWDGEVVTMAGIPGNPGSNDGPMETARFKYPSGVAVDSNGTVYVADRDNHSIRMVTFWGEVSTVAGLAGAAGAADGTNSAARFNHPCGVAVDGAGVLYVADRDNHTVRKIVPQGDDWVVTTLVGRAQTVGTADGMGGLASFLEPCGVAVDSAGNLYVTERLGYTVRKITPAGEVTTLAGHTKSAGSLDGTGPGAWFNKPLGVAVDDRGEVYVADSGNNIIRKGVFRQYVSTNAVPYTQPPMTGSLVVTLLPSGVPGQWRFPWELGWHSSGEVVSNLVAGNYPVEFRNPPGYVLIATNDFIAVVRTNTTTWVTNQYLPTLGGPPQTGWLKVNISGSVPTGGAWRLRGETTWRASGSTATNLLPDIYGVEFAPVSGMSRPPGLAAQVVANQGTEVSSGSYSMALAPSPGVALPAVVPSMKISNLSAFPFGFNGQLLSDAGWGSGVAVRPNVVLTAAHVVFNDQTLSYVGKLHWFFRRDAGVFEPEPLAARGWYVLGSYAAQRTNDLSPSGGYGVGQGSPASRNLDVAAIYFPSPVAGGGYGGYLPSDMVPNPWLTGTSPKMLAGYPVDGSMFGDATIVPGKMYQTGPSNAVFTLATNQVFNPQVYTASWLLSYPGNSGGPLYVDYNGYYYPAGVYLGTLYNGVVPYASLVRGIDSTVESLIAGAQELGDSGTNGTGGGVITITAGSGSGKLAYLQVNLGPEAAVNAGAAWRLAGSSSWCGNSPFTVTVPQGGSAVLEFKPIPGWDLPASQDVDLTLGGLRTTIALYTQSVPVRLSGVRVLPDGALAMTLEGTPGGIYAVLASGNLLTPLANWPEVLRLTNTTGQTTFTNPPPAVTPQYYRAREL